MQFEQLLTTNFTDLGAWRRDHSPTEFSAYQGATNEAFDLHNGAALLVGASVAFRDDLLVDYLGECDGPDGSICDALSFRFGDALEVVICNERDGFHARFAYRGDRNAFEQIAVELMMFESRCFSHLRDDQAAA
ncbi:hypothetical protein ACN2C7_16690 [Caulobacter sp. ErkDOM-E]|uniref:hypothetical protein n=1 Tax=Caulobacter sp. ErkDOM-E TaxID=3402778 RepID=UPI003AF699B4